MRVVLQEIENRDTMSRGYAVLSDGSLQPSNYRSTSPINNNGSVHWTVVWEDVADTTVIIAVTVFLEFVPGLPGRGYWRPVVLPPEQTDAQILTVERILNIHGLSLVAVVGLQKKWAKGARR